MAEPTAPTETKPAPLFNGVIRNVTKVGVDELQDYAWRMYAGKVRVSPPGVPVPPRFACSCDPWCGGRYFPSVLRFRDLTWKDVEALLRREYGDYEFERWTQEMSRMKRLAKEGKRSLAHAQGSSPLYPTFLPIPFLVENALNHDFHEYLSSTNPDKPERFRFLRQALAPMVID